MKSYVSMLFAVAEKVIYDVFGRCSARGSADRDLLTLRSRIEHEGLSFLTITLPSFGADFERSLSQGFIDPKNFLSFRKFRQIPAFLQGIVSLVFNADTGRILDEPSIDAIEGIRQMAYTFKKIKIACAPSRVRRAFESYISDEQSLQVPLEPKQIEQFRSVCNCMWPMVLSVSDLEPLRTIPAHGPGSTAERISGNQKYAFKQWHSRLEPYYPIFPNAFTSVDALGDKRFKELTVLSSDQEPPVRVVTVPKTLKSPRIIAMEPVVMQYAQQALSRALVKRLEAAKITSGHVNFTDQKVNQRLAMNSSITGHLATLDLSSASDRVPLSLVEVMLESNPDFRDAVLACRSTRANLPTGDVISLRKFASMGSALCFPIESMYFYTLCVGALLEKRSLPVTSRNAFLVSREVYVYGDDIIVPSHDAEFVVDYLHKYYCKVNMSKSFWSGNFRESCGMDAFKGKQVTPVYLREVCPDNKRSVNELISWTKTASLFLEKGYFLTSDFLYKVVENILGKLPFVHDTASGLGRLAYGKSYTIEKWSTNTHVPLVRAWVPSPVYRKDKLTGYAALLKCLLTLESRVSQEPSMDKDHLSRTARHGTVTLKRRWVRPY